uniref:Uncharacterized protein n=1 Tax=Rhizophora mucronata TaxID=61149 RepID=A0A2P2QY75_RHIMU
MSSFAPISPPCLGSGVQIKNEDKPLLSFFKESRRVGPWQYLQFCSIRSFLASFLLRWMQLASKSISSNLECSIRQGVQCST